MALPMRGVTTQVFAPKSSTAWTTALKNEPDTRGAIHSLLRMHVILLQTVLALEKLFATAGQLSYAVEITCLSYLEEVTIFRGRP